MRGENQRETCAEDQRPEYLQVQDLHDLFNEARTRVLMKVLNLDKNVARLNPKARKKKKKTKKEKTKKKGYIFSKAGNRVFAMKIN